MNEKRIKISVNENGEMVTNYIGYTKEEVERVAGKLVFSKEGLKDSN